MLSPSGNKGITYLILELSKSDLKDQKWAVSFVRGTIDEENEGK